MNPSTDEQSTERDKKDYLPVYNSATGQILYCKKNTETNKYEVVTTANPTPKVVNLMPKFSRVCTTTFEVIIYAVDPTNNTWGKYIFKNNEFVSPPDCLCDSCKIVINKMRDEPANFFSQDSTSWILISIEWLGCHMRGKNLTYVSVATGVIGTYRSVQNGMILENENHLVRMLPVKGVADYMDHQFVNWKFCGHIQQNIYICKKEGVIEFVTFNKMTHQFEIIQCDCSLDANKAIKYKDEKMRLIEVFSTTRLTKYIGIFVSKRGKLLWKEYSIPQNKWVLGSERVVDCREMTTESLLLRYHFDPVSRNPAHDLFQTTLSKFVFMETSAFGFVYWMLDEKDNLKSYKWDMNGVFHEVSEIHLFQFRMEHRAVTDSKYVAPKSLTECYKQFNSHVCDKCKGNIRLVYPEYPGHSEKLAKDPQSLPPLIDSSRLGTIQAPAFANAGSTGRNMSPPDFPAPPPPTQSTSLNPKNRFEMPASMSAFFQNHTSSVANPMSSYPSQPLYQNSLPTAPLNNNLSMDSMGGLGALGSLGGSMGLTGSMGGTIGASMGSMGTSYCNPLYNPGPTIPNTPMVTYQSQVQKPNDCHQLQDLSKYYQNAPNLADAYQSLVNQYMKPVAQPQPTIQSIVQQQQQQLLLLQQLQQQEQQLQQLQLQLQQQQQQQEQLQQQQQQLLQQLLQQQQQQEQQEQNEAISSYIQNMQPSFIQLLQSYKRYSDSMANKPANPVSLNQGAPSNQAGDVSLPTNEGNNAKMDSVAPEVPKLTDAKKLGEAFASFRKVEEQLTAADRELSDGGEEFDLSDEEEEEGSLADEDEAALKTLLESLQNRLNMEIDELDMTTD